MLTKGKRRNKIEFIDRISSYFPSAKQRREDGEIIVSTPGSVLNEKAYTLVDGKQNEINKLWSLTQRKGKTLIPLKIYFDVNGRVKVQIGTAPGKDNKDKSDPRWDKLKDLI